MSALAFRSLLFVAAHDEERLVAAFASGADAVVADLEDATPPAHKAQARRVVADRLPALDGAARLVRINVPGTELARDDLEAVAALELDAIVVPQATPERIAALGPAGPPLIAVIESAAGLRQAYEVASAARVEALVLDANDLGADLGVEPRADALELLFARPLGFGGKGSLNPEQPATINRVFGADGAHLRAPRG